MAGRQVALCLACSSSPSPRAQLSPPFITPCCTRPICERCLSKNPRLRGYNPCLACLAGAAVVRRSMTSDGMLNVHVAMPGPSGQSEQEEQNVFVLEDSDDEDDGPEVQDAPPPYIGTSECGTTAAVDETLAGRSIDVVADGEVSGPSKYYIQPGDTLRGIVLRYNVDGRKVCQLNSLPISTLSTTPHLLHTRRWLNLPPSGRRVLPPDPKVLEAHNRKRAEKRFQFVTKEIDCRVAKAYVALAEDEDEDDYAKTKEVAEVLSRTAPERPLAAKAVDQYLDDEEWEAGQSGTPQLQGFPPFATNDKKNGNTTFPSRRGKRPTLKY